MNKPTKLILILKSAVSYIGKVHCSRGRGKTKTEDQGSIIGEGGLNVYINWSNLGHFSYVFTTTGPLPLHTLQKLKAGVIRLI